MSFATTDLVDAHPDLRVLEPLFSDYGGTRQFAGPVSTVKVHEDNVLVRQALEEPGNGRVLVVDGGGSKRVALLGGMLGRIAQANGWAGVLVYGCVRDTNELRACTIGVRALATHPRKSAKNGFGERDIPVTFAGVTIRPGDVLYADEDGIVLAETDLLARS